MINLGSVRKAAEILHQTDAAISRKITKLENHLGTTLIKSKPLHNEQWIMQRHGYRTPKQVRDEWNLAMMEAA